MATDKGAQVVHRSPSIQYIIKCNRSKEGDPETVGTMLIALKKGFVNDDFLFIEQECC